MLQEAYLPYFPYICMKKQKDITKSKNPPIENSNKQSACSHKSFGFL